MLKLTRTHLRDRPSYRSVCLGLMSFMVLLIIFLSGEDFSASGEAVFERHEYWRLFTATLAHADYVHLGHNAVGFTLLSILLNHYFGWLVFPVASLVSGILINAFTILSYPPRVHLVGVSGVVYFMAAFWFVLFFFIERQRSLRERAIVTIGLMLIFLFPQSFEAHISHRAHAWGFALGALSALIYYGVRKTQLHARELWIETDPAPIDEHTLVECVLQEHAEPLLHTETPPTI